MYIYCKTLRGSANLDESVIGFIWVDNEYTTGVYSKRLFKTYPSTTKPVHQNAYVFYLFNGISTFVGYLMQRPFS